MTAEERFEAGTLEALQAQISAAEDRRRAEGWQFMSSSISHRAIPKTAVVRWTRMAMQEDDA